MTDPQEEIQSKTPLKRRIGKIGLAIGASLIVFVIVLGLLTSVVSAYDGSTELHRIYDAVAGPGLVFGSLLVLSGLVAILLPEGLSQDGVWVLKTGPYQR